MQWKPNVTVAAIAEKDGEFLTVEEYSSRKKLVYNQPAGHLEPNETLFDAVKREVMEETAYKFEPEFITGIYLYPNPNRDITYLRVCFFGHCVEHFPEQKLDKGIVQAKWLNRQQLDNERDKLRTPLVMQCIDDYLSGQRYSLALLNHYLETGES